MAPILRMFPGVVPQSDQAVSRQKEAERLRQVLLDDQHRNEMYSTLAGMGDMTGNVKASDLMTPPDEVRWGSNFSRIVRGMGANVLIYGSLRERVKDVQAALPMVFLPGVKGDRESEQACEEVQAHYEAIEERDVAERASCDGFESGFAAVENIWDVDSDDYVAPVSLINRPRHWFGFDHLHRPRFKPEHRTWNPEFELVPDFKVSFLRCGSLHTPYGQGYAEECYPAVYAIDELQKGYMTLMERWGYMPIVVTYPNNWQQGGSQYRTMASVMRAQWKNVIFMPGEVTTPTPGNTGSEVFNAVNASAEGRLKMIALYTTWLSMRIVGSQSTSGSDAGSFAKEAVLDSAQLWKAPSYAACREAQMNRGFIKPVMLVNRPTLDKKKWPHVSIDASFGEDIASRLSVYEAAVKYKIKVAAATFSEEFKIQLAQPGDVVLEASAQPPQLAAPVDPNAIDAANPVSSFAEQQGIITVYDAKGTGYAFFADQPVYTENRGVIRASKLVTGDIPNVTDEELRRAS